MTKENTPTPEWQQKQQELHLTRMGTDHIYQHRKQAAAHPATPVPLLITLLRDRHPQVSEAVRNNPSYLAHREHVAADLNIPQNAPDEWRERLVDIELKERYPSLRNDEWGNPTDAPL